MNIYFPHSKQLDFRSYYNAFRTSDFNKKHTLIFPYESEEGVENSKAVIQSADIIIAEVSYPATGLGIELGWANDMGKRIICVYKKDVVIARSLHYISKDFISYGSYLDIISELEKFLKEII